MDCFSPLDLLLTFSGCRVVIDTSCSKIINKVIAIVIIFCNLATMGKLMATYYLERYLLLLMARQLAFLSSFAFIFIINKNRKKLRNIILRIIQDLSEKSKKRIKKWSKILAFFGLLQLTHLAVGVVFRVCVFEKSLFMKIFFSIIRVFNSCGYFFTSGLVYLFMVKLIFVWEQNYFNLLIKNLKNYKYREADVKFLVSTIKKDRIIMNEVKKRLIGHLSFLPVLWFLHLFLYIAGVLVFSQRTAQKHVLTDCLTDGVNIFYELAVVISVMLAVDEVNQLIHKKSTQICTILSEDSSYFIIEGGLRDFKERCTEFEFSVYNLFTLNKRLFLGFLSSLLSFTALFVQITNTIYNTTWTPK